MYAKRVSLYLMMSAMAGALISYFILFYGIQLTPRNNRSSIVSSYSPPSDCKTNRVRLAGYHFINPVLYADKECESDNLNPVKENIIRLIDQEKQAGLLTSGSVYVRLMNTGDWTIVNAYEGYHPASLNKVPVLITYLRMGESNPSIFNQKIQFKQHDKAFPVPYFKAKTLVPGNTYKVRELLEYMIRYSDNDAFGLLLKNFDNKLLFQTFKDLGLPEPTKDPFAYTMTVREYSVFMRVLYGATYISKEASEYGISLLAQSEFNEGLVKRLPPTVKVAHKFGESGMGDKYELHESGLVYNGANTYLITVMTKGTDLSKLALGISEISNMVYTTQATSNPL